MTFDDDCVRLHLPVGNPTVPLVALGLEWPPPERLFLGPGGELREAREGDGPDGILVRRSMSQISDEERAGMTHVFRGADYAYLGDSDG